MKKINLMLFCLSAIICIISCKRNEAPLHSREKIEYVIFDSVALLSWPQKADIFSAIQNLEKKIGSQIAVVIIDSLGSRKLEVYSLDVFEKLDLGREQFDDGILITVVSRERKIRIEVGTGLEKIVKDEIAARILREQMVPNFKENNYFQGIKEAVDRIKNLIEINRELIGQSP